MNACDCHCAIPRDGASQRGRYLKALDPSYAPIDGRRLEDLLVFAKRYASHVRFYDVPESEVGQHDAAAQAIPNWREFFRRDLAVIAASIATVDTVKIKRDYDQLRATIEARPSGDALRALFDPILGMVRQIDRWYQVAIAGNPLRADLELAIASSLREQVDKVRGYEEAYKYEDPTHPLQLDYSGLTGGLWGLDQPAKADRNVYQGDTPQEHIRSAALYVDDAFSAFYGFLTELVTTRSLGYLTFALQAYPAHQPHMALFIAFLELFQILQEQMNGLTARMLDFYYRDVLRLEPKPAIPDRAHIVFELAQGVVEYDISEGTALKGGKDAAGKDLTYKTTSDLVVNQAKVKELKNVLITKKASDPQKEVLDLIDEFFASPVANSADGQGAAIADPSGKWWTFGRPHSAADDAQTLCDRLAALDGAADAPRQHAGIGFAVASPQLLLQGGRRVVAWKVPGFEALGGNLQIFLTGAKGWIELVNGKSKVPDQLLEEGPDAVAEVDLSTVPPMYLVLVDKRTNTRDIVLMYIPPSADAVIGYDPAVHGQGYDTRLPMVRVMVDPSGQPIAALRHVSVADQLMIVQVGSFDPSTSQDQRTLFFDGLKALIVENDTGVLDSSKPFDPFTAYPQIGKSFYVGSPEIFNKPFTDVPGLFDKPVAGDPRSYRLAVNIRKTVDDDDNGDVIEVKNETEAYATYVLRDRAWVRLEPATAVAGKSFTRLALADDVLTQRHDETTTHVQLPRRPLRSFERLADDPGKGFLRFDLSLPRPRERIFTLEASQNRAPHLEIKEISISYMSVLAKFEADVEQLFHVYPFGVVEVFLDKLDPPYGKRAILTGLDDTESTSIDAHALFARLDAAKGGLLVDAHQCLLPQFTYVGPNAGYLEALEATRVTATSAPTPATPVGAEPAALPETAAAPAGGSQAASAAAAEAPILVKGGGSRCAAFIDSLLDSAAAVSVGTNQYSGAVPEEGLLFIGVEGLRPLDTLSLLFQFAEGSAADEDNDPPDIHWAYLTQNEWRPLKGENLVSDGTYGFQTTGIVKIDVPADSTDVNTIMTPGLRWFCASVSEHAERIPMLVNVVTQAVEARLDDIGNDPSHFDVAFPAGSIGKLVTPVNEISKVAQPFASFDGKHREVGREFYTRVSERLRHKARAITAWDYEHLVLDRFPSIYKVKCIPHMDPNCLCRHPKKPKDEITLVEVLKKVEPCCGPQVAPGHVLVVPISNLKSRNAVNPLQPKTSRRTLLAIQDYLSRRTSPFVHVHARNPVYEQILVFFRVQFTPGTNKGYFLKKLNDEIVHYLTPWAFDENAEVSFGQKVFASSIINFIEERPYVDFIVDFLMFVCREECCPPKPLKETMAVEDAIARMANCCDAERLFTGTRDFICDVIAEPSTPRSILVSAPRHIIVPYEAPPRTSPCEERRKKKQAVGGVGAPMPAAGAGPGDVSGPRQGSTPSARNAAAAGDARASSTISTARALDAAAAPTSDEAVSKPTPAPGETARGSGAGGETARTSARADTQGTAEPAGEASSGAAKPRSKPKAKPKRRTGDGPSSGGDAGSH